MKTNRVNYLIAIVVYIFAFGVSYKLLVTKRFDYFGFGTGEYDLVSMFTMAAYMLLPAFFIPIKSERPSVFVYSIVYFVVYIPSLFVVFDKNLGFEINSHKISLFLFLSILINILSTRMKLIRFDLSYFSIGKDKVDYFILFLTIAIVIIVLHKVSSNFSLISIEEIYQKRAKVDNLNLGKMSYLISWLTVFLLPVLIARNFLKKKQLIVVIALLVYLFLYFTLGAKIYLFVIGYFVLAFGYVRRLNGLFVPYAFSAALLVPLILYVLNQSSLASTYIGVVNLRVFTIQGLAVPVYVDFFSEHAHTLFSHISGVNFLIDYQYDAMLSVLMEREYGLGNFNAPYFVGDGYAGYGYPGMLFIAVIVSTFFYFLDSLAHKHDYRFVILSLSVFVVSFSNVSFATSMLTGGGLLFILYFAICSKKKM